MRKFNLGFGLRSWPGLPCALALLLLLALELQAQQQSMEIRGQVLDPSGSAVAGAQVEVRGRNGLTRAVTTDGTGFFRVPFLLPGRYTIEAGHPGFDSVIVRDIRFSLSHSPRIIIELPLARVTESVDVRERPHLLDYSSAARSESITDERFERLPHGRDFMSLMKFVPGVAVEPKAKGPSIHGATGAENRYLIDGIDVTDPIMGTMGKDDLEITNVYHVSSGKNFLAAMVDEVQVKTAGYEAELGGATGGIINVVTRSGTNELQGTFGLRASDSQWSGEARPTVSLNSIGDAFRPITPPKDDVQTLEPLGSLSGPLVRDHLWYFASYQPEIVDTDRTVRFFNGSVGTFGQEFRRDNASANVTASIATNLFFKLAANASGYETDNDLPDRNGFGSSNQDDYTMVEDRLRNVSYSTYADLMIDEDLEVTARAGRYLSRYRLSGNPDEDILYFYGTPEVFDEVPEELIRPSGYNNIPTNYAVERDDYTRDNLALDGELHVRFHGDHWAKAGIQFEDLRHDIRKGLQEPQWVIAWDMPDFFFGERGTYGSININADWIAGSVESRNTALFIQDRWTNGNWMVSAGLRAEEETIPSYADPSLGGPKNAIGFDYGDRLAPRLGFAWDPLGNGKWKASGSYGRYFDRFELALPLQLFGGRRSVYYSFALNTFDWPNIVCTGVNALPNDQPSCTGAEFVGLVNETPAVGVPGNELIAPGLRPTESEELMLGLEHEREVLGRIGLALIHRELVRAVDTVGILTQTGEGNLQRKLFIANPGVGIARDVIPGRPPLPEATREYDAIEIRYESPADRRWWVQGAYLYSRLWGNYGGVINTDDIFQFGPNRSGFADTLSSAYDASGSAVFGRLPTDRPHQLKIQAMVQIPWEVSLGLFQSVASGTPITEEWRYQGTPFFPRGRGNLGRTPTLTQTDLLVRKIFGAGRRYRVHLDLNALNLFDEDTEVALYSRYSNFNLQLSEDQFFAGFDPDQETMNLQRNPLFGMPTIYQSPREIWVSLRVMF